MVLAAEGDEHGHVAEVIQMMDDRRDAERAHGGKEDRCVERADLQQELRQEAEVIDRLQQPDGELEQHARDVRQRLGGLVKVAAADGLALDLRDALVELLIDILDRVGGLQMELGDRLRRGGIHRGLDDHAELDIIVARIDLLAGEEAVERRVFRHALDVGGQEYVRHAEVRKALLALFADIALHGRDLHRLADEVGRADPRGHNVVGDDRHRVERAELAAVGPVAPGGMVGAVKIHLHAEQRQNAAEQEQKVRQDRPQLVPVFAGKFLLVHRGQHGEGRQQQKQQRDRALDMAGDRHGVERGDGQIRDPEHERQPQIGRDERDLDAIVDGEQEDGNGRAVEPVLSVAKNIQHIEHAGRDRQHDQKPHRPCVCAFPTDICDAERC